MLICAEYELPVLAEGEEDAKAIIIISFYFKLSSYIKTNYV